MEKRRAEWRDSLRKIWFPLALALCLIVLLPGLVLLAGHLLGAAPRWNDWLERRLGISFHFPLAAWTGWTLLAAPVLLILLYFLKLRRQPRTISSTYLWHKSMEDLRVNRLFRWLRNNVLLLMQLVVLIALIFGILGLRLHGVVGTGRYYILMIDNSASMSARDSGMPGTRLEAAKEAALREIDAAPDDAVGMLIVFNSTAEIRQSYTRNKSLLRQRVREVEPTQRQTRIEEALALADSLANQRVSAENEAVKPEDVQPGQVRVYAPVEGIQATVHLYSDGRFPEPSDFILGNLDLRYHPIGPGDGRSRNVGVVAFNALRDDSDRSVVRVFARLVNIAEQSTSRNVELVCRVDGRLHKQFRETVTIPAARRRENGEWIPGERSVTFEVGDVDEDREAVFHLLAAGADDDLAADNEAWLVVGIVRKARILIVGAENRILRAFFDDVSTRSIAEVDYLSAADWQDAATRRRRFLEPGRQGAFDLVIFDRLAPEKADDLPQANTFFIGVAPPTLGGKELEPRRNVFVKAWLSAHPLLRYLSGLHEIGVGEAVRIVEVPPRSARLLEGPDETVLLFTIARGPFTDVVQTFPLLTQADEWNTNWPLQPSFPMFWRNVVYEYGGVRDSSTEEVLRPGSIWRWRVDPSTQQVEVTDPDDRRSVVERSPNRPEVEVANLEKLGLYRIQGTNPSRTLAVNLLDEDESMIHPRESLKVGDHEVSGESIRRQPREIWKWLIVIALVAVLVEWFVYNRRVAV